MSWVFQVKLSGKRKPGIVNCLRSRSHRYLDRALVGRPRSPAQVKIYHALVQYLREMEKSKEAKVTNQRLCAGASQAASSTVTSAEATSKAKAKGKGKAREVRKSKFRTKRAPNSGDQKDLANIIGKDGKLLPAKIEHRIKYNLCSYCGEKDHKRDECPNAAKKTERLRTLW